MHKPAVVPYRRDPSDAGTMAPVGSVTVPAILAVGVCARSAVPAGRTTTAGSTTFLGMDTSFAAPGGLKLVSNLRYRSAR